MGLFKSEIIATPQITGITSGVAAPAGYIGEVKQSQVAVGSAVSITTVTPTNVTSVVLTPGDWDIEANVNFTATSASVAAGSLWVAGLSTTTATVPVNGTEVQEFMPALTTTTFKGSITVPNNVLNVTASTTVYLVFEATFTAGTLSAYGSLVARRIR